MRSLFIFSILFCSFNSDASSVYMNGGRVQLALESIAALGSDPGVGAKNSSCLLCHASAAGGPGNINSSFGADFRTMAQDLGYTNNGGGSLPATGSPSLAELFSQPDFLDRDSDGDGESNGEEFAANTDPADNVSDSSGSGGSSGGGCGMTAPPNPGPFSGGGLLLLALPFFLLLGYYKTTVVRR